MKSFFPFLALILAGFGPNSFASSLGAPDYSNWYQVEVIVFALRNPPETDEAFTEQQVRYPQSMLTIAPTDPASLGPASLSQLKEVLAYDAFMGGETDTTPESRDDFLFESRSHFNSTQAIPQLRQNTDSSDPAEAATPVADLSVIFDSNLPRAFELVPSSDRFLSRIAGSVNRSSRYRLLSYSAWRQPVEASDESWPVLVQAGDKFDDLFEIDGTLAISRSRYLHVEANLWFTQFVRKYDQDMPLPEIVSEFSAETLRAYPELVKAERTRGNYIPAYSHQMQLSRRMRSGTLHYLDNPYFGVLIQIEGFDYEPPEATE